MQRFEPLSQRLLSIFVRTTECNSVIHSDSTTTEFLEMDRGCSRTQVNSIDSLLAHTHQLSDKVLQMQGRLGLHGGQHVEGESSWMTG